MNQDTIPSQLGPMTIPAALGPVGKAASEPQTFGFSPAMKWLLVAVAIAVVWYFTG